jgi:uncharacterized membrane protein
MKACCKCGYQNTDVAKICVNCFINLHWAKENLGNFSGTTEDTKRIGEEERKRRFIDNSSTDRTTKDQNKTQNKRGYLNFFTVGFGLFLILDFVLPIFVNRGYMLLNFLCPISFAFLVTAIATLILKKDINEKIIVLISIFVVAAIIGFVLLVFAGGFMA